MKRKRGSGKRKSKLAPVVGAKEAVPNIVSLNTQDDLVPDDFDNAEFDSRMEVETPQNGSRSRQQANLQKQKVIDATMGDSMSSSPEMSVAVSANLSKKARSIMTKSSRGFVASSIEPGSNAEQVQNGRTHQKEANSLHQDPQYEKQELKTALLLMSNGSSMHWVIKMVMKMDAAEPFNVPVDPVALAIPICLQRLAKKAKNFQGISYSKLANLPPIVGLYSSFVGCRFLCEDSHILLLLLLHGMQIFMSKLMMMFM